jgi:hypothetical protein
MDTPQPVQSDLTLELRVGDLLPLPGTAALAGVLQRLTDDLASLTKIEAEAHVSLDAVVPVLYAAPDEPEWLQAAELLEEAAACPGERLLGKSLTIAAGWWRPNDLEAAVTALAGILARDAANPQALQGCAVVLAAIRSLPADRRVRLAWGSAS